MTKRIEIVCYETDEVVKSYDVSDKPEMKIAYDNYTWEPSQFIDLIYQTIRRLDDELAIRELKKIMEQTQITD